MKLKRSTILLLLLLVCAASLGPVVAAEPGQLPGTAPEQDAEEVVVTETEPDLAEPTDPKDDQAASDAVQNAVPELKLSLGQTIILRYRLLESGMFSWHVVVDEMQPQLLLRLSILSMVSESEQPAELSSSLITQGDNSGTMEQVAAGDVMLLLTLQTTGTDWIAETGAEAKPPSLTLQATVAGNLEPNDDLPARMTVVSPDFGSEYFGNEPYLTMEVLTEPFYPVYFGTSDEAVAADQHGSASQSMRLTDGLINSLQAFTVSPGGHISLCSVVVLNHWVTENPAQTVQLSRQPTIELAVPAAGAVDLERSQLTVDGQPLALQADLANNVVYARPIAPLALGLHRVEAVLLTQAPADSQQAEQLLDSLSWQFVIPEHRVADFWPDQSTYVINQQEMRLDAAPYLDPKSSTTMLPLRVLGELMDANVQWLPKEQSVIFQRGSKQVQVFIDRKTALVDGRAVELTLAPALVNNRTMVPLRFVTENLGAQVTWNQAARQITVRVMLDH